MAMLKSFRACFLFERVLWIYDIRVRLQETSEKKVFGDILLGLADGFYNVVQALLELVEVGVDERADKE